jgi:hypothetical protein
MDSMPQELDELMRKMMQLEIEEKALETSCFQCFLLFGGRFV